MYELNKGGGGKGRKPARVATGAPCGTKPIVMAMVLTPLAMARHWRELPQLWAETR